MALSKKSGKGAFQFDPYRKLANMRLTEDERRQMLYALMNLVEPKAQVPPKLDSAFQLVPEAEAFIANWGKQVGISSGYPSIDRLTKGFDVGELVVLGGYTSRGKTQLAVNIAYQVATQQCGVLFVSMELTKAQVVSRFMRLGQIDQETPLFLQPEPTVELADMDGLVRAAMAKGAGLVVVDHLHYFARGANLLEQVGAAAMEFKQLAVRYGVPVLLLSQLKRPDRQGKPRARLKVPGLSDLKESGYIETDADIVLMVHRDLPDDDPDAPDIDQSQVVVALRKNRNRGFAEGSNLAVLRHDTSNGVLLYEDLARTGLPASQTKMQMPL